MPDRTARRAEAAITIENGFHDRGLERELTARIVDEAQRHHLNQLRIQEQSATRSYRVPVFQLQVYAASAWASACHRTRSRLPPFLICE